MTTAVEVRRAAAGDARAVSDALAAAFSDDPVVSWLLPSTVSRRDRRMRRLWSRSTAAYLRRDKPVTLTSDGGAAALWSPPATWLPYARDQLRDLPAMAAVFGPALRRAGRLQTQMVGLHPRKPHHWYLYAIGARPGSQGRGLGSALLRDMLDRIDIAGEPAYLESSNGRNVPLYERHGFQVVEEIRVLGDGPPMWRMWRDPRAS